ncbi:hypothetical protein [Parvibacter caecicola]|uniref:Putative ATPase n=1 Tax=Parvibacter caecicola TaxID=747645 RepID=A0A7W5D1F4_9ACTN|nr:hypothetical protein [Parvibacter caecicola]MBB3171011.1 putative ATPase [Parvibacter caecicola]MCR2042194.1 hypothetical protein [Parvibacter caecicola]
MRIDLHCHTNKTKSGDPVSRNVDKELLCKKAELAGVDLIAITNHNDFDFEQYQDFSNQDICIVWPGVELDGISKNASKAFHVIVVADPAEVDSFNEALSKLINGQKPDDFSADLEEIVAAFIALNTLFIPHYADKAKAIGEEDKKLFEELVPRERLFLEPKDLRTVGICAFHGDNMIIGSDVRDWAHYEECNFAELRLPVSSFEQLKMLAKRDTTVVQHLLDAKTLSPFTIHPVDNESFNLEIYNDVNIVFGEKGTGKSRILDSIASELKLQGKRCVHYAGSKRDEDLAKLLEKTTVTRSAAVLGVDSCENDFSTILNWNEPAVTPIKDYLDWIRTNGNDDAKIKMCIVKMTSFGVPDETELTSLGNDANNADAIKKAIAKIDLGKYLTQDEEQTLQAILGILEAKIIEKQTKEFVRVETLKVSEFTINTLKTLVAGSKGSKPIPTTVGFEAYACARLELAHALRCICSALEAPTKSDPEYLGPLDGKGDLFITTEWSMFSGNSTKDHYSGTYTQVKNHVAAFKAANKNALKIDYRNSLKKLTDLLEGSGYINLDCFVGVDRFLTTKDGKKYEPSNGEKGILLLRRALDREASFYLIDEPELGMGNTFIEDSIRPKLIELGRLNKTVVVATHNANIAVRCLPYRSIYREHVSGDEYRTYIGNPFVDKLTDITDQSNSLNWTETSLRTLEGGREAFDERGYIYDSASC